MGENAQFSNLITILHKSYISEDGSSFTIQNDYSRAMRRLYEERRKYLENAIMYDILRSIWSGADVRVSEEAKNTLEHLLLLHEANTVAVLEAVKPTNVNQNPNVSNVESPNESTATFFGTEKEDFKRILYKSDREKDMAIRVVKQTILPEVEAIINERYELVESFLQNEEAEEESTAVKKTNLATLHTEIVARIEKLRTAIKEHKKDEEKLKGAFWAYFDILCAKIELMKQILSVYVLGQRPKQDEIKTRYLVKRTQTLVLKLRLIRYQILSEAYTAETVSVYKYLKKELDSEYAQVRAEAEKISEELSKYSAVGAEFQSLLKDYEKLGKEIQRAEWELKELCGESIK